MQGTCASSGGADVAFKWTAPSTGLWNFSTVPPSGSTSFETVLYVRRFVDNLDCGGTQLGSNDDAVGTQSRFQLSLTAGQSVIVVVDGFGSASGNYWLTISP